MLGTSTSLSLELIWVRESTPEHLQDFVHEQRGAAGVNFFL